MGRSRGGLIARFAAARASPDKVVLEGLHAFKHALRFGAHMEVACSPDRADLLALADRLAPDICVRLDAIVQEVSADAFTRLADEPPATGVLAIAERPSIDPEHPLTGASAAPIVLLERPELLGNLGAVVRVAAAADAAGVLVVGPQDPWHPIAVRAAAGLQFALPVGRMDALPPTQRPLVAIEPEGQPLTADQMPGGAILAFGSERRGLSTAILDRASLRLAIPMRPGVSSLNLASAVAVTLYAWRLAHPTHSSPTNLGA
ncbi:MAG: TrmH family RNA methyltransferase [Pseudomonadota bacterium]